MVSDDFKCSYYRFLPGFTPEQATDTSTNTSQRNPVNPFSATTIPLVSPGLPVSGHSWHGWQQLVTNYVVQE